jgi:hypothetical protein
LAALCTALTPTVSALAISTLALLALALLTLSAPVPPLPSFCLFQVCCYVVIASIGKTCLIVAVEILLLVVAVAAESASKVHLYLFSDLLLGAQSDL